MTLGGDEESKMIVESDTRETAWGAVSTHADGSVYRSARGRYAPKRRIEDAILSPASVVAGTPTSAAFVLAIERELRIRYYQPTTIRNYRHALQSLLRWFNRPPHALRREDVREFLLYLVDAGASSSFVSIHLSAIRTAFDKMCGRQVTLGLASPRRPKKLPIVLSVEEVTRLIEAAPTTRDKLLLGLMYATGIRVSEATRLRFHDIDFDRRLINIWQGKGRRDRQVTLPRVFEPWLRQQAQQFSGDAYLFSGTSSGRHMSIRTAQRIMQRAVRIAHIKKPATPHSLRHTFATHTYENGCDIRHIQQILGHVHLQTTTIYVKVAQPTSSQSVPSPLDVISDRCRRPSPRPSPPQRGSVGNLRIHLQQEPRSSESLRSAKVTLEVRHRLRPVYLTGILAREVRSGWVTLTIPPLETWEEPLSWLEPSQRERMETPEFFQLLQREIPNRLLATG
jgi:site-specific recombinase XerD